MTDDRFAFLTAVQNRESPHSPVNFWLLIILVLGLLALAVAFLGDGRAPALDDAAVSPTPGTAPASRVYTVSYKFGVFSPTNLRIRVGDTVTFRNDGSSAVRITAQPDAVTHRPAFDSVGLVPPDSSFSYTFIAEGVFAYSNASDERQAGVIIVRAP